MSLFDKGLFLWIIACCGLTVFGETGKFGWAGTVFGVLLAFGVLADVICDAIKSTSKKEQ